LLSDSFVKSNQLHKDTKYQIQAIALEGLARPYMLEIYFPFQVFRTDVMYEVRRS